MDAIAATDWAFIWSKSMPCARSAPSGALRTTWVKFGTMAATEAKWAYTSLGVQPDARLASHSPSAKRAVVRFAWAMVSSNPAMISSLVAISSSFQRRDCILLEASMTTTPTRRLHFRFNEHLAVFHLHLIRRQIATHKGGDKAGYHSYPRWLLHPSHEPTGGYIELGAVPRASQDCALQLPLAYWGAQVRTAAAAS